MAGIHVQEEVATSTTPATKSFPKRVAELVLINDGKGDDIQVQINGSVWSESYTLHPGDVINIDLRFNMIIKLLEMFIGQRERKPVHKFVEDEFITDLGYQAVTGTPTLKIFFAGV